MSFIATYRYLSGLDLSMTILNAAKRLPYLLQSLLFALVCFCAYLVFWNSPVFGSDESEIFIKGIQISRGELLYLSVDSQHMPLMYHVASIMATLGVHTITGFRVSFYLLYSVLLGMIYNRYSKILGKKTVFLFTITYFFLLPSFNYGTSILSEHFQGLGMVILLFELLCFKKSKSFDAAGALYVALASVLSFCSAFVSVFGIFVFYLALISLIITNRINDPSVHFSKTYSLRNVCLSGGRQSDVLPFICFILLKQILCMDYIIGHIVSMLMSIQNTFMGMVEVSWVDY